MRIVCISDTHNLHVYQRGSLAVPEGDVLVHCGDATMRGTYEEVALFATWFAAFPHKHKIFVPGNHDWIFEERLKEYGEHAHWDIDWADCLIDNGVTIDGVKFWGSPWQPEFCNWAFNLPRGPELKKHWDLIPADTDVLITHSPPLGILDGIRRQEWKYDKKLDRVEPTWITEHVGCADMWQAVRRVKPQLHAFGHIHVGYGQVFLDGTHYVNCAVANEKYMLAHPPIVVDL